MTLGVIGPIEYRGRRVDWAIHSRKLRKGQGPMLDKRVLVAGASGDIGHAIATRLVQVGAALLLLGRHPEKMPGIGVSKPRHEPAFLQVDLTDLGAVERLGEGLLGSKSLDALVLSVGAYHRSEDPGVLRVQLEANVTGPYALLRTLLPSLVESKGQIVFVNSSQALRAGAEVGQYAATKHALKAIADSLREEVNRHGVRVSSIYLGRTAGNRQREIFAMEGRVYKPERLIQPSDVADIVLHLLQLPRTAEVTDVTIRPMRPL
jgi:NADP-dependent 3-hydroxy acid dehydrogenase YdfG